jgi:hypothetical protein
MPKRAASELRRVNAVNETLAALLLQRPCKYVLGATIEACFGMAGEASCEFCANLDDFDEGLDTVRSDRRSIMVKSVEFLLRRAVQVVVPLNIDARLVRELPVKQRGVTA